MLTFILKSLIDSFLKKPPVHLPLSTNESSGSLFYWHSCCKSLNGATLGEDQNGVFPWVYFLVPW